MKNFWFNIGFGIGLLFMIATMVCATADQPSIALSQGQTAPYAGVLIDPARAQRIDDLELNYSHLVTINNLKDQDMKILNDRLNNADAEMDKLSSKVTADDNHTHLYEVGFFILGAGLTGLVSYGIFRAAH
jgi:hypothetical protein